DDPGLLEDERERHRLGIAQAAPELLEGGVGRAGRLDVDAKRTAALGGDLVAQGHREGAPLRAPAEPLPDRVLDARADRPASQLEVEETVVPRANLDGDAVPGRLPDAAAVAGHGLHDLRLYHSTVRARPSSNETCAV